MTTSWEKDGGAGNARKAIVGLGKFWVMTGVSWSRQSFWSCVTIGVPCFATWFSNSRQLLGRDIVFSCCDSACFSVVTMSRQRFSCRDRDDHDKRLGVAPFMLQHVWS